MSKLTVGGLFSGIGGIELGLQRAGMKIEWMVENDPFCQQVLAKHWPNVRRYGDVRDCGKHNLKPVDLIAGGFPCQPYSVAGERKGKADDRNLWPEFLRIIEELRPSWVLAENVPGIVSLYLDTMLSDLESEGYTCWTFDIPACAFDAPHIRKRIFVVAYAKGKRATAKEQPGSGHGTVEGGQDVPHPLRQGLQGRRIQGATGDDDETVADGNGEQAVGPPVSWEKCNPWAIEPDVGRVAHGISGRVHRLRALGNAVVPQVAEWLGRVIVETDRGSK